MNFQQVREFLESWGLGFDTPTGDSSTIPYPSVYHRMRIDAEAQYGYELSKFISSITNTMESQTYLAYDNWAAVEIDWNNRPTIHIL